MEKKLTAELQVLVFSTETTFIEMTAFVGGKIEEMADEAAANSMQVAGAPIWIYTGSDGNPETRFILDICLPVQSTGKYNGTFELRTLPAFSHVGATHLGPWENLGKTYGQLMGEIMKQGEQYTGVCREIYHVMNLQNPLENVTEVQVGIK